MWRTTKPSGQSAETVQTVHLMRTVRFQLLTAAAGLHVKVAGHCPPGPRASFGFLDCSSERTRAPICLRSNWLAMHAFHFAGRAVRGVGRRAAGLPSAPKYGHDVRLNAIVIRPQPCRKTTRGTNHWRRRAPRCRTAVQIRRPDPVGFVAPGQVTRRPRLGDDSTTRKRTFAKIVWAGAWRGPPAGTGGDGLDSCELRFAQPQDPARGQCSKATCCDIAGKLRVCQWRSQAAAPSDGAETAAATAASRPSVGEWASEAAPRPETNGCARRADGDVARANPAGPCYQR